MAFYIDRQILDLNTIKFPTGKYYEGQDEIKSLIAGAWRELDTKFFKKNLPVVFKTPGIRSGGGKGNQGYSYPRAVFHKTKKGQVHIAWADNIITDENKRVTFTPLLKRVGVSSKTITLTRDDIEEVLFMFLFNPNVLSEKNPTGRTFLVDKEADALKYEEAETSSAVISYWLFRKESALYANETLISTLCLAWGINPDGKSMAYRKQLLAEAVKRSEKRKEVEFNLNAFNVVCEKLKDGQDTGDIDNLALIQKCVNNKVIKFDQDKLMWVLLGIEGNALKTICKVPPQLISNSRNVLKKYLAKSPDDVQVLQSAISEEPTVSKHDKCKLSVALPEEVTQEYIQDVMSWPDKKAIYTFLGNDSRKKTMEDIHPILIEYFVVQKRTIPFIVKA